MEVSTPVGSTRSQRMKLCLPQYAGVVVVTLLRIANYMSGFTHTDMYGDNRPSRNEQWNMFLNWMVARALSFVLFAFLFETLSRKTCTYIISVMLITTSILHLTANTLVLFHIAHALRAIGHSGCILMSTIYICEIGQNDIRGSLLLTGELLFNTAQAVVFYIGREITTYTFSWFAIAIPVVVVLCFIFWLPETPIYFLRRGNRDAASRSLMWFRRGASKEDIEQEVEQLEEVLKATRSDSASKINFFRELVTKRTLIYIGIVCALCLTENFGGIMGVHGVVRKLPMSVSPKLYTTAFHLEKVSYVAGTLIALCVCDGKGRRILMLITTVLCFISIIPITLFFQFLGYENALYIQKIFALIFGFIYLVSFSMGLGNVITVIIADVFSPKIRNLPLAFKGILNVFQVFVEHNYIYSDVFEINVHPGWLWSGSVVCACGAVFIYKFLPETMKRPAGFLFMENEDNIQLSNF